MKTVSAAEANRNFSRILREVAAGEKVIVTSRGKPVAEIVGATGLDRDEVQRQKDWRAFLDRLRQQPFRNHPKASREDMYD